MFIQTVFSGVWFADYKDYGVSVMFPTLMDRPVMVIYPAVGVWAINPDTANVSLA
jgi:hypothetical protein